MFIAVAVVVCCVACKGWDQELLPRLAHPVEARADVTAYTTDPTKATRPGELLGKRTREEYEDYKRAVVDDLITTGRAETPSSYLIISGDHDSRMGDKWQQLYLTQYRAASWLGAAGLRSCSLSVDATRIGNPAEDTTSLAAWVTTSTRSFGPILPPQARGLNKYCEFASIPS